MVLAAGAAAAVMLAAGCGDRRVPTAAGGAGRALFMSDAASGATCAAGSCLLANTILPLQSGLYEPDSSALMVPLGEVLVQLQPGDSVTLAATVSPDLAASLPPDEQLVAVSGPDTVRTPLRGNSVGATIYRAVAADSVRIHVGLTRRLSASPRSGAFTVSVNYGSAPLLSAWTPWIASSAPGAAAAVGLAASATTCTATAPGPSSCPDISVSIVPYAPGDPFGDFQSDPGTGVSNPITVIFSQPVTSVTITIEDPTYAGNAMTAYRADGSMAGSVSFTGSGIPGIDIPDTQTITAAGIVRIVLTPAPLDYVAYAGLSFTPVPVCNFFLSPPADTVLANNAVQIRLNALWTASNPADNFNNPNTRERGGLFFVRTDGSIGFYEHQYLPGSGPCRIAWDAANEIRAVQRDSGGVVVGQVHTHPIPPGKYPNPGTCGEPWQREQKKYPTIQTGSGPSEHDLADYKVGNAQFPSYIVEGDRLWVIRPSGSLLNPPFYSVEAPLMRNPSNTCPPVAP